MGNPSADSCSALPIRGRHRTPKYCDTRACVPWPLPPPHLIFRLLFLRVQDIMQHDCGFLWGRRHLMYVTVATADHWPRPDHRRVCPDGASEERRGG